MKNYKLIDIVTASFVAVLIISNIASTKIVSVGPLTFDGGTILFPLAYIFGDVLTEVYGYARSRRVIWTGFVWVAIASIVFAIIDNMPAAPGYELSAAFSAILGQVPRIVVASLIAFFAGEFSNSFVLAKMKIWTGGKHLWMRTIGSTLVGELVDSALFILIAFWGQLPKELITTLIISNYIFKVGVEVLFTPVTYKVVSKLKKIENEDYYDIGTNFSPFATEKQK
jgi:queuosine precursor transporter